MEIICSLLSIYMVVLLVAIVLSWFPLEPGGAMAQVYRVLWQLTNPILAPVRRAIPAVRIGGGGLDLSPLVVLLGIRVLLVVIGC